MFSREDQGRLMAIERCLEQEDPAFVARMRRQTTVRGQRAMDWLLAAWIALPSLVVLARAGFLAAFAAARLLGVTAILVFVGCRHFATHMHRQ
jgi:hypothetical protein